MRIRNPLIVVALAASTVVAGLDTTAAGPSAGGLSSDNVRYVTTIPFEHATTTGARIVGDELYVTSWKSWSIYDISDPLNPKLLSTTPFAADSLAGGSAFRFENEDVSTNGKILVFSETLPSSALYVYDVEDKTNPVLLSRTSGLGQHTMSCVFDCQWLYGSDGHIIDLRNPSRPKLAGDWTTGMPASGGHDVTEVSPGIVLTATDPMLVLDARTDPAKPQLIATSEPANEFAHSVLWPQSGTDTFALSAGETWTPGLDARCDSRSAGLTTWNTSNWQTTHTLNRVATIRPRNGTGADGNPPANAPFGCSAHWFDDHPQFAAGGLVAAGYYNHGTRIYRVGSDGRIAEIGWFVPHAGGTSAAYWVTGRVIYAIDYQRGFDVLEYTGTI